MNLTTAELEALKKQIKSELMEELRAEPIARNLDNIRGWPKVHNHLYDKVKEIEPVRGRYYWKAVDMLRLTIRVTFNIRRVEELRVHDVEAANNLIDFMIATITTTRKQREGRQPLGEGEQ